MKPFLKWPGGKHRLSGLICSKLSAGRRLVEPFTGSGAVFLNSAFELYLLADSNPDLINLYQQLAKEGHTLIRYCQGLFLPENNSASAYYRLREEFNASPKPGRRAALFLYLNRHCYNGLMRYNSKRIFNTPFGRYLKPYFPEKELLFFLERADQASFLQADYRDTMELVEPGDVVYCDPPYDPLSETAKFTEYHAGGFSWKDQEQLALTARDIAGRGIQVVISNHNTPAIRRLYQGLGASIETLNVHRSIGPDTASRKKVEEVLAVFEQGMV